MTAPDSPIKGILSLPNELLYTILEPLPTKTILLLAPTSRRLHALSIRLLHNRLTLAASLADRVLYLEIYPPAAKLTASGLYCSSLGTPALASILEQRFPGGGDDCESDVGKIGRMGSVYSRFRPQRKEPKKKAYRRPGDIPGSRTHPATVSEAESGNGSSGSGSGSGSGSSSSSSRAGGGGEGANEEEQVGETVSLEAEELFTQLCAVTHLIKTERGGVFSSLVGVCDGLVRVWRDWLKEQAEVTASGDSTADREMHDPATDKRVLWVNKGDNTVGIRCKVKEKKWRRDRPVLVAREEELPVSYYIEFEELYVRTSHLLFKMEEARAQESNTMGRAMIFRGSII